MAARRMAVAVSFAVAAVFCAAPPPVGGEERDLPQTTEELVDDLITSALKSELDGDANERTRLLDQAQLVAPDDPRVNWLAGRVQSEDDWLPVKDAQADSASDARFAEYRKLRAALDGTARSERALARWCGKNNWPDAERFHYARLLAYPDVSDAAKSEALRKLNMRLIDGELFTPEEAIAHEAQRKSKQEAFDLWRPKIVAWRKAANGAQPDAGADALAELRAVDDPQVILAADASLYDSSEAFAIELLSLLGKFREFEATEALVRFALLTDSETCVKAAVQQLKSRPIHDFYPQLMVLLQAPVRSEFRVQNEGGDIRYETVVSQEGPFANRVARREHNFVGTVNAKVKVVGRQSGITFYEGDHVERTHALQGMSLTPDSTARETGLEQVIAIKTFLTGLIAQRQIALANAVISLKNERIYYLLEETSPQVYPRNPANWWGWWQEYNQRRQFTPTIYSYQRSDTTYQQYFPMSLIRWNPSCFLAGTKVQTQTGLQAIETIQPGDRVLARNVETGELEFKLVYATTLREPSPAVKLSIKGEEITATKGHPFWVAGKGWTMAKELVPGDVLHTLAGPSKVESLQELPVPQPAHNLVVADFNNYFVGVAGLLAHDNTYWKPTPVRVPGERAVAK